jgi:ABC-type uncharacterized transport system auxiliary subunit
MTILHRALLVTLVMATLLTGCANLLPNRRPPPATPHDLGWLPPPPAAPLTEIPIVAVECPPWLNDPALRYRPKGGDATSLQTYPDDYWLAPPRELVLDRLRQSLLASRHAAVIASSPRYRLEVRLLKFEQEQSALNAEAVVTLQALLKDPRNRRQYASPVMEERVVTPSGPSGAVRGLGEATDQIIARLMTWTAETQTQMPPDTAAPIPAPNSTKAGLRSLFPERTLR